MAFPLADCLFRSWSWTWGDVADDPSIRFRVPAEWGSVDDSVHIVQVSQPRGITIEGRTWDGSPFALGKVSYSEH